MRSGTPLEPVALTAIRPKRFQCSVVRVMMLFKAAHDAVDHVDRDLKLMLQSKDPLIDAMADDLATYSLDVALADEGYMRTCRNLFFIS